MSTPTTPESTAAAGIYFIRIPEDTGDGYPRVIPLEDGRIEISKIEPGLFKVRAMGPNGEPRDLRVEPLSKIRNVVADPSAPKYEFVEGAGPLTIEDIPGAIINVTFRKIPETP